MISPARAAQVMMALSNAKTRLQVAGVRRLSNICCMFWMRVTVISSGIRLPKISRGDYGSDVRPSSNCDFDCRWEIVLLKQIAQGLLVALVLLAVAGPNAFGDLAFVVERELTSRADIQRRIVPQANGPFAPVYLITQQELAASPLPTQTAQTGRRYPEYSASVLRASSGLGEIGNAPVGKFKSGRCFVHCSAPQHELVQQRHSPLHGGKEG